jgi:hypothetical protein
MGKIISGGHPDSRRNRRIPGGIGVMKLSLNFDPVMGA